MSRARIVFLILFSLFLILPKTAVAQAVGGACTGTNQVYSTPSSPNGMLICNGSTFVLVEAVTSTPSMGIGTASVAAGLTLAVNGNVGATNYCDVSDANCFTPSQVATVIGAGAATWSALGNPTGALALTMGANTSTFTYNAATGTTSLFKLTDTASNTGTGYMLELATNTSSTEKPFHVSVNNGGTNAITVLANGQVGIGTASPSTALTVSGTDQATAFNTSANTGTYNMNGTVVMAYPYAGADTTGFAIGPSALISQTANNRYNIAVGPNAGQYISTSHYNTAVGENAMTGVSGTPLTGTGENTAFGYNALNVIQGAAQQNVAIGVDALLTNTTGSYNTAVGTYSQNGTTTGSYNTAVGGPAMTWMSTGTYNTAIGYQAMQGLSSSPVTGSYNTATGGNALSQLQSTATKNTANGYQSGYALITGTDNTLLGYTAGQSITGNSNIVLGEAGNITSGGSNILIGNNLAQTTASNSNQIDIGDVILVAGDTHLATHAVVPTLGTCTNGAIAGNDNAMVITASGALSSCAITFKTTWTSTPVCTASASVNSVMEITGLTTTALTITPSTALGSGNMVYILCHGYK